MENEKYVDESWKEIAEKEKKDPLIISGDSKEPSAGPEGEEQGFSELNFMNYITSLAFQAMIFLGEIPSPLTNKAEKNLTQAKFIIDTLALLKEKTANNLTPEENDALNTFLYELQMKFVDVAQKEGIL